MKTLMPYLTKYKKSTALLCVLLFVQVMEITNEVLQSFIAFSPTDIAIYRVKNGILETLFLSENIPDLLGMTREEYLKITARDAMPPSP